MLRPVALIAAAILNVAPHLSPETARSYAVIVRGEAAAAWDPLTIVALISEESEWRPAAEGDCKNGVCHAIGLGQIHYRHLCKGPLDGPACQAARMRLYDPAYSIRVTVSVLTKARKMCREKTGRAWLQDSLSAYAGRNQPPKMYCGRAFRRGRWVQLPLYPGVRKAMHIRRKLLRLSR